MGHSPEPVEWLVNPVTRNRVRFFPPFLPETDRDLEVFRERFGEFCMAAWRFGRQDPPVVQHGQHGLPWMAPPVLSAGVLHEPGKPPPEPVAYWV